MHSPSSAGFAEHTVVVRYAVSGLLPLAHYGCASLSRFAALTPLEFWNRDLFCLNPLRAQPSFANWPDELTYHFAEICALDRLLRATSVEVPAEEQNYIDRVIEQSKIHGLVFLASNAMLALGADVRLELAEAVLTNEEQ